MPFDQWYDDATREAATARVLQRRMTNPGDRNTLTVVADEFDIPQQTLAAWVEEASPDSPTPPKKPRPKFSQVVRTSKPAPDPEPEPVEEPEEPEEAVPEPAEDATEAGSATSEDAAPEAAEAVAAPEASDDGAQPEASDDGALPEATPEPAAYDDLVADADHVDSPESDPAPEPLAETPTAPPAPAGRVAALEAEAASLRTDKAALIAAIRILLER